MCIRDRDPTQRFVGHRLGQELAAHIAAGKNRMIDRIARVISKRMRIVERGRRVGFHDMILGVRRRIFRPGENGQTVASIAFIAAMRALL